MKPLDTAGAPNPGSAKEIIHPHYTPGTGETQFNHDLDLNEAESENTAFVENDKSGSSGSSGEFIGMDGSYDGSFDRSHETKPSKPGYVIGSKPEQKRKSYKAGHDDDDEKESKLAKQIADSLKNSLCYDETGGDWYSQTKGLWRVCSEKKALRIIMEKLDKQLPNGYGISKLNNMRSFLTIYLLMAGWESKRHLLPMTNGVLDTSNMQLTDYSHEHRFNWQLPYAFDADAKIDIIRSWLWSASGKDAESINIIRAFFKMALVGGDVQKFLELIGPGGTGKSTLIRLLVAFIGEKNHAATDLKNLETNRFEAAAVYGKRLVLISDSSRYGGEVSTLKALTGGDPVRLEKKNLQQCGSFVFDGVVVIASNEAIQTADYTSGLIRRRMPVNFNRKVTDADKAQYRSVGGIEPAMHKELPGLLNWVLSMTEDDVKQVIGGINGQMTQAQREHLIDTNKIAAWLEDNIIVNFDAVTYVGCSVRKKQDYEISRARTEKLYANYETWCDDAAVHSVALNRFTANVLDVCAQVKIDVIGLDKDSKGKPLKGIAIREAHHSAYATPITGKLLNDPQSPINDLSMTRQAIDNEHNDLLYTKNSLIINTPEPASSVEYF